MRSLGETIKDKRKQRNLTRTQLEDQTKIRKSFLVAIEEGNWNQLPEFPVVQGFIRSIAHFLEMDESLALALLRRDYPKKDLRLVPTPDVKNKFIWSPKWTLFTGAVIVTLVIVGYLGYQYKQFVSPPFLRIDSPKESEIITTATYTVIGETNPDATVIVNNQPSLVFEDGNFREEIEVSKETQEIVVKVTSRSGKETEIRRKVKVEVSE
jgi:cytoskeletal protein RodZ